MANLLFSSYCVYQKVGMRYLSETTLCLPLLYYTFGKRDIIGMICLHLNRKDFHFIREIILLFPNQIQIRSRCTYPPTIKANKHTYGNTYHPLTFSSQYSILFQQKTKWKRYLSRYIWIYILTFFFCNSFIFACSETIAF